MMNVNMVGKNRAFHTRPMPVAKNMLVKPAQVNFSGNPKAFFKIQNCAQTLQNLKRLVLDEAQHSQTKTEMDALGKTLDRMTEIMSFTRGEELDIYNWGRFIYENRDVKEFSSTPLFQDPTDPSKIRWDYLENQLAKTSTTIDAETVQHLNQFLLTTLKVPQ